MNKEFLKTNKITLDLARKKKFPCFLNPINESFPANSSPYYCNMEYLKNTFSNNSERIELYNAFSFCLELINQKIGTPVGAMLGGSFLDLENSAPRDIDAVVFYESSNVQIKEGAVAEIHNLKKSKNVDLRLCPLDFNPLWGLKVAGFYANLFMSSRSNKDSNNGCLLIDLIESGG